MIVQYASDLHLEFPENKDFLDCNPIMPVGDILLLAGDIVPFAIMDKHKDFFSYLSNHFETTYWIPGNHEYYYFDLSMKCGTFIENIKENVHLVNNVSVVRNNIRFIFSTLWSSISPANQWQIERSISDFQVIKFNNNRLSADRFNQLHQESLQFITAELQTETSYKSVVATHHVPTFMNYPEKYKGDALNDAFAVELFSLIESSGPDAWVFGHHHSNTPDFTIGNTQLLTNQLGYVKQGEHRLFNHEKCFNL